MITFPTLIGSSLLEDNTLEFRFGDSNGGSGSLKLSFHGRNVVGRHLRT